MIVVKIGIFNLKPNNFNNLEKKLSTILINVCKNINE